MKKKVEDPRWKYMSFDFYEDPIDASDWLECPECHLTPRIWEFDNGRHAHCVCGQDSYNHKHTVKAKPVGEFVRETGGFEGYDRDELRKNWNAYVINSIK